MIRKLFLSIFVLILTLAPLSTFAATEYSITNYNVNMTVDKANVFHITETITANFNVPKHGIYRTIPLKNTIIRQDGSKETNRAIISNIKVNEDYTTSTENGNKVIKIGDADGTLTGRKTYTINYDYNIGKDKAVDYDELYFNMIGNEWDTTISNFSFTINMPDSNWETSNLGFSSGVVGSTNSNNINYNVNYPTITGNYLGVLDPGEGVNVRLQLPEGYFDQAKSNTSPFIFLIFVIPVIFSLIAFYLWRKYGKDDEVIETIEFYPPEGFNSAEIGYLYKGSADSKDITSLLIYLANKGYIRIEETESKGMFSKAGFKIIKVKEYDGDNSNEKMFLNGLFRKRPPVPTLAQAVKALKGQPILDEITPDTNEVTKEDLYDNFYITLQRIQANMNTKENHNKIFESATRGKSILVTLMVIITFALITIPPVTIYYETVTLFFALLFPTVGFSVMFHMLFGNTGTMYVNGKPITSKTPKIIFGLLFGGIFGGAPWAVTVLPALLVETIYLYAYIWGLLCVMIMLTCLNFMSKRTPYGNQILGKIEGFKHFLQMAEKDKLEELVYQDPTYFYNILPYTYVLGVSDKWIKKFEAINTQAPDWYYGHSSFSTATFGAFMATTMSSSQTAMSSSPSSSGGGSSGGGSGGGGGGSW